MKTKKITLVSWVMAISLALLLLIPFSTAASAAGANITIGAPVAVPSGQAFLVNINITGVEKLNAFQFDLTYNNSIIQVAGLENGSGVSSGLLGSVVLPVNMWGFIPARTPGKMRVFGNLPGNTEAGGQGYLAQIHFNAVGLAGQTSNLDISRVELVDGSGALISASVSNGSVTIASAGDQTLPTVISVSPAVSAAAVPVNSLLTATFSEAVNSTTVNGATFTLMDGFTPVSGSVVASGDTATFTPAANLAYSTTFVATLSVGITDLAGNHMANSYFWSFTTAPSSGIDPAVSVTPPSANVTAGGSFIVTIDVGSVANLNAYQFDLGYNNAVVQVVGSEGGPALSNGQIGNDSVPLAMWGFQPRGLPGCVRVLGHLPGVTGANGEGYLTRIQFTVVGAVGQSSALTLSNVFLYDVEARVISSSWFNGVVTVASLPLEITTSSLLDGMLGSNYSRNLAAQGGQGAYSWSASGLPDGLTLSAAGVISGQPAVSGDFNVVLSVADSSSPAAVATRSLALHVYPALQINSLFLPDGSTAASYSIALTVSGGKAGYSWSAAGLPAGLTLSTSGILSGKPVSASDSNVIITVADSFNPVHTVSKTFSLKIWLAGDANNDGQVTMADVTKTERMILGLDPISAGADANGDGEVNMGDVTRIEIIILGI